MKRYLGISFACFCALALVAGMAVAAPVEDAKHRLVSPDTYVDIVGDVDGTNPAPQKVQNDTTWIATWTFDQGACDGSLPAGWMQGDNYIRTGSATGGNFVEPGASPAVYWSVDNAFNGQHTIAGNAARLGYIDDITSANPSGGYAYGWYQGLQFPYQADGGAGVEEVSFDYLLDSELGFDFLRVESDENCASFTAYDVDMLGTDTTLYGGQLGSDQLRDLLYDESDLNQTGSITVELMDYGAGNHCFYIAFASDGGFDPWDGDLTPTLVPAAALVVDNVVVTDAGGGYSEDFSGGLGAATAMNMHDAKNFNTLAVTESFARTFEGITDNDLCTENTTCAILNTDDLNPSIDATFTYNAPGNFVIKNWLDDVVFSPWVSLALGPANAKQTFVQFRRFPGNNILNAWIVQNWSIRGGNDVDDGMGGTVPGTQNWGHVFQWNSLGTHRWVTSTFDASINFESNSEKVQLRFRQSDWQWIVGVGPPPAGFEPGPGPHFDRIRIGRRELFGPVLNEGIDARYQAQDCAPTEIHPLVTPAGDHYRPLQVGGGLDRFGTAAFSQGTELGINNNSPNLITGDSITTIVEDVRDTGAITSIGITAQIVAGPHAGMAPPPHVGPFFTVNATQSLTNEGTPIEGNYFVDFDDEYFVGGDEMHYFWFATDAGGGYSSNPVGLIGAPADLAEAQAATGGMFQVNFLPTINWNAAFIADVAANNKVDPLSDPNLYVTGSEQKNCILYVNHLNSRRRSGDVNRTSFMWSLDALGYKGHYDVYDHTGMGNTNNHLGGRVTTVQAVGYRLVIYDTGNQEVGRPLMPRGDPDVLDVEKVDQDGWFQTWLNAGGVSEAGQHSAWFIGKDLLDENQTIDLYATECATSWVTGDQGVNANPDSEAQAAMSAYMFQDGTIVDFTDGAEAVYSLAGGCPTIEDYDGQASLGSGVDAYIFADPGSPATGDASIVVNSNSGQGYNTIFQSHAWGDIREEDGSPPNANSANTLMASFLQGVLGDCTQDPNPTGTGGETPTIDAPPSKTTLFQNRPNPFNPATKISFDLAQSGHVSLKIYDVAGRAVRTLVSKNLQAGRGHEFLWDGFDDSGQRVSSGVYFYRLDAPNFTAVNKMVMMK